MQESKHARGEQSEYDRVLRATQQLFGTLMERYFRKWLTFVWTAKRRNGQLGKAMQFLGVKTSHKYLLIWHSNVHEHVKRRRPRLSTVLMLCIPVSHDNSTVAKVQQQEATLMWRLQLEKVWFRTWCLRALEQRQSLRKRARKVYRNYIASVLVVWLKESKISIENKRKFKQILQKMRHSKSIRILQAWQVVAGNLRDTRKALGLFTMGLQRSMVKTWKNMIVDIKYQRYLEQRGDVHHLVHMKKIGIHAWYAYIVEQRLSKRRLLKALRLLRHRLATMTIDTWRKFIVYKHNMLKKALIRARHSCMAHAFAHWYSLAAGRLERLESAIRIQSVVRGFSFWKRWPGELSAFKWATGIVQAAWRGRVGRKLYTKQYRRMMLVVYKQLEIENDQMEIEDIRMRLILQIYKAATLIQRQWRGVQGRDFAYIARTKRKLLQSQQFNIDQKRKIKEAEEAQAQREENQMLQWLASMRVQAWWRGCLGKKTFRAAKLLKLMIKSSVIVQSNFRAMKARRKSAAKRRMKFDSQQSLNWRAQQGKQPPPTTPILPMQHCAPSCSSKNLNNLPVSVLILS